MLFQPFCPPGQRLRVSRALFLLTAKNAWDEERMADELGAACCGELCAKTKTSSMTVRHFSFVRFVAFVVLFCGYSSYVIKGVFNGL